MDSVSVFGLGKVGITLVSALLAGGYRVIGVDVVEATVKAVNNGTFDTPEPGVMERLRAAAPGQFTATMSAETAVAETDFSFIIVPTPSNTLGGFSNEYVIEALKAIGAAIRGKTSRHTVSLMSTVLPGSSANQLIPALEKAAGRKVGPDLGYCYNPSFIAQGEVMKGIITPDYILVGEADPQSGNICEEVHRRTVTNDAPVVRCTPTEGEIIKIGSNTHETMRVAFANMLLALCNEVPDVDVDRITTALAHRLGRRFFKGAVPYGGPCWPRDNRALAAFMDMVGVPSTLPDAIDRANAEHGRYILQQVLRAAPRGATVGILGLAYKPGTSLIERSFSIDLAQWLSAEGRTVIGWDPMANGEAARALGHKIEIAAEPEAALKADVVVIALPLSQLTSIDWSQAAHAVVIDCWRVLEPAARSAVAAYVPLGTARTGQFKQEDLDSIQLKHLVN
jgi:UDPglucose 6-dehydrogenase